MATSPLNWEEIQTLREAAADLNRLAAEAGESDMGRLMDRSAVLHKIADQFDYGYVAGKPRELHPNPACFHCGKRHWDTVEKLADHYIRRHGYVDENSDEAHEVGYDVIGQNAAADVFSRAGIRKDTV